MTAQFKQQFADPRGILIKNMAGNGVLAVGSGAPTDSVAGYSIGCYYVRTDGGASTAAYVNVGSATSSTWKKLGLDGATIAALTVTALTATTATITTLNPTSIVRASQTYQLGRGGTAKAGTTAGWTVNAGNNIGTIATVAASQTSSTLVVAIPNLHVGDTITGFGVYSSINSAGGAVTLDANLRSLTIGAAASATDASIASITQVSVSAATASSATKTGLSTVVTLGVNYYLLLTATTAGSTTIELDQIEVTVTTA